MNKGNKSGVILGDITFKQGNKYFFEIQTILKGNSLVGAIGIVRPEIDLTKSIKDL